MNNFLMWVIMISALLGGLDKIFGGRFGLGKRFDEGFALIGPLISGMVGILCLAPLLSRLLQFSIAPFFSKLGLDPAILAGILPIDMGGYQLAADLSAAPQTGLFAGIIITATFGCTLCFTIPVGFEMMQTENRPGFIEGIQYGLMLLPLTLLSGGLLFGLGLSRTVLQSLPTLILALLLSFGMWRSQLKMIRIFTLLAQVIRAVSVIGILLGLLEYLTGTILLPGILSFKEALLDSALCGVLLVGCLPMAEILNRLLRKPLHALGSRFGLQDKGITGMLLTLVSVTAALGLMHDMDPDDTAVNAAFLVSAAAVLGPHLSVCAANAPQYVSAMIFAKLAGGLCSAVFAVIMLRKRKHSAA